MDVKAIVVKNICAVAAVEVDSVTDEKKLREDLNVDEVEVAEVALTIEEEINGVVETPIEITDEELNSLVTVKDLVDLYAAKVKPADKPVDDPAAE